METVGRLQSLNGAVIAHVVPGLGLRTLTVDVDGVVVSTGQQVERAFRGSHSRTICSQTFRSLRELFVGRTVLHGCRPSTGRGPPQRRDGLHEQ